MSKKETLTGPSFEDTEPIENSNQPSFEETEPLEDGVKKKVESTPSASPSVGSTSNLATGASVPPTSTPIEQTLPGQLSNQEVSGLQQPVPTNQPKVNFDPLNPPKIAVQPQGLSAATTPSYQTAGDANTTGGISFDQSMVGKTVNAVVGHPVSQALAKGTLNLGAMLARTPAYLSDLTNRTINTIVPMNASNLPSNASDMPNPLASSLEAMGRKAGEENDKEFPESASYYFDNGEYEKGFKKMGLGVAESMPTTLSLMAGNAAGLGATALGVAATPVFAAGEKQQMKETNPDMPEEAKNNVAMISGALESVTESMFGNVKLGSLYANLLKKEGAEVAKKTIGDGVKNVYKEALKKYLGNETEEVASEMSNEYLKNLTYINVGGDKNKKPFDNVMDAGLIALGAGHISVPGIALDVARQRADVKKAQAIKEQQDAIKNEIKNPDISPDTKEVLVKKLENINVEEDQLTKEATEKHDKLPDEKKTEVDNLLKENHETLTAALDPNISKEGKEALTAQVEKNDNKIDEIHKENDKLIKETEKEQEKHQEQGLDKFSPEQHEKDVDELLTKIKEEEIAKKEKENAVTEGKVETSSEQEHQDGNESREATKASGSDSNVESGNEQQKEEVKPKEKTYEFVGKKYAVSESDGKPVYTNTETKEVVPENSLRYKKLEEMRAADEQKNKAKEVEVKKPAEPKEEKLATENPSKELVDKEDITDEPNPEKEVTDKLDLDLESFKKITPENLVKKYTGVNSRIDKMMEDGTMGKRTGKAYKKLFNEVYDEKIRNIKEGSTKMGEELKKKILGQYKGKVYSSLLPVTPDMVAKLIDAAVKIHHTYIDLNYSAQEAAHKAMEKIKDLPLYQQLKKAGSLKEAEFQKEVSDKLSQTKEFAPEVKEEVKPVTEESKKDNDSFEDNEEINSELKTRGVFKNFLNSVADKGLKDAVKEIGIKYPVAKMKVTDEIVDKIIKEAIDTGNLDALTDMVIDKNSNLSIYDRGAIGIHLAKLNSEQWANMSIDDKGRDAVRGKFKKLYNISAEAATLSGQTSNYIGKVNKLLFESDPVLVVESIKEGIKENVEKQVAKKGKKLDKVAKDIDEVYKKTKKKEVDTEKLKKLKEERQGILSKLKSIPISGNKIYSTILPIPVINLTDEHFKQLGKLAVNYLETGVVHTSILTKKICKDFFDAFGQYLSKNDIDKVLNQDYEGSTIKEVSKKLSEERRKELDTATDQAFREAEKKYKESEKDKKRQEKTEERVNKQNLKEENNSEKTQSDKIAETATREFDKIFNPKEETTVKDKKQPQLGDVEAAKNIIDGLASKDTDLSMLAKKELVKDLMHHLDVKGELTPGDFKLYYGNALGLSKFNIEDEQKVQDALSIIRKVDDIAKKQAKQISILESSQKALNDKPIDKATKESIKKSITESEKAIYATTKEFFKAQSEAEYANRDLSRYYKDFNPYEVIASNIQLNLLTTASAINNVIAYIPTAPVRFSRNSIAAGIDAIRYKLAYTALGEKMGLEKNKNFNRAQELKLGYQFGFTNGLYKSGQAIIKGNVSSSYQDRTNSYEYNSPRKFKELTDILKSDETSRKYAKAALKAGEATLTIFPDAMSRLLAPGDLPTKERNKVSAAVALASKEGATGAALLKYVFNPSSSQEEYIDKESARSSYQGDNVVSKGLNSIIGQTINKLESDYGATGYHAAGVLRIAKAITIPFIKTPSNLVDELLEMMFPIYSIPKAMVYAGKGDARRAEQIMGNAVIGSVITGIAFKMFAAGLLHPSGDQEEKKEKDILYASGGKPGEINLSALLRLTSPFAKDWSKGKPNDTWINYEKLGSPGMVLGTTANYYDRQEVDGADIKHSNLVADMFRMMPVAMSTALNQSFLKNVNDIQSAVNDKTGNKLNKFASSELQSLMASIYPNTIATLSQSGQKYIKDKTTIKGFNEQLKFDLKQKFFSGNDLPNKVDVFGRPVKKTPDESNRYVYYMLNPIKSHEINTNTPEYKLFDFFSKIDQSNKDRFDAIPTQPSTKIQGKDLSGKNYEEYQEIVGKYRHHLLGLYTNSESWRTDTESEKIDYLKKAYKEALKSGKDEFISKHTEYTPVEKEENDIEEKESNRPDILENLPGRE